MHTPKKNMVIIDYEASNLLSVARAFTLLGADVTFSHEPTQITAADYVVLPGVGAFQEGMQALKTYHLDTALKNYVAQGGRLFAICLGLQLLFESSEEFGYAEGLGILKGTVKSIPSHDTVGKKLRLPHLGWNRFIDNSEQLTSPFAAGKTVYFAHSFYAEPQENITIAQTLYGGYPLTAAVQQNSILACQFHPEKSGEQGLNVISYFLNM